MDLFVRRLFVVDGSKPLVVIIVIVVVSWGCCVVVVDGAVSCGVVLFVFGRFGFMHWG